MPEIFQRPSPLKPENPQGAQGKSRRLPLSEGAMKKAVLDRIQSAARALSTEENLSDIAGMHEPVPPQSPVPVISTRLSEILSEPVAEDELAAAGPALPKKKAKSALEEKRPSPLAIRRKYAKQQREAAKAHARRKAASPPAPLQEEPKSPLSPLSPLAIRRKYAKQQREAAKAHAIKKAALPPVPPQEEPKSPLSPLSPLAIRRKYAKQQREAANARARKKAAAVTSAKEVISTLPKDARFQVHHISPKPPAVDAAAASTAATERFQVHQVNHALTQIAAVEALAERFQVHHVSTSTEPLLATPKLLSNANKEQLANLAVRLMHFETFTSKGLELKSTKAKLLKVLPKITEHFLFAIKSTSEITFDYTEIEQLEKLSAELKFKAQNVQELEIANTLELLVSDISRTINSF
jgi:hypothetical protein